MNTNSEYQARAQRTGRRICRQVLECGDGVGEVTALALAALKILKFAANTLTPTESGDSADSVAAVQDARARIGELQSEAVPLQAK